MMMMMMMVMCKRFAQVPMLCVRIYNMKLAMMQTNSHFYHVFSTYEDDRRKARARRGVWPYGYYMAKIWLTYGKHMVNDGY